MGAFEIDFGHEIDLHTWDRVLLDLGKGYS
jgi:hypothetical protein